MSHCLRECQAQVPIQVLIEHLFYSSSSYINVYFFPLLLVFPFVSSKPSKDDDNIMLQSFICCVLCKAYILFC